MNIEKIASEAGMFVVLDGRIGREEYKSVHGSLESLHRFADGIRDLVASESCKSIMHNEISAEELSCY